jgi:hypothetical protein
LPGTTHREHWAVRARRILKRELWLSAAALACLTTTGCIGMLADSSRDEIHKNNVQWYEDHGFDHKTAEQKADYRDQYDQAHGGW